MYIPRHFAVDEQSAVDQFLQGISFATLVTIADGVPEASHLPVEYCRGDAGARYWLGHMARANLQWRRLQQAEEVLLICQGAGAYISPSWYSDTEVPTWNYQSVHVYARPSLLDDGPELRAMMARLIARHESPRVCPVRFEDYEPALIDREIRGAQGFRLDVLRCQASFKLSQNRPAQDQAEVARNLTLSEDQQDRELGAAMRKQLNAD